jgi:hypothetical protein
MKDFYFSNEDEQKNFLRDNKWLICSLIVEGVKKSLDEGLESLIIFRLINPLDNFILTTDLKKNDWEESLKKCLEYYESIEEYEMCDKIIKLLKTIKDGTP